MLAVGAVLWLIPSLSLADTIVTLHVETKNRLAGDSTRFLAEGDYHFVVSPDWVVVAEPTGSVIVFDFNKKVVSSLDRSRHTYYELRLDDWLDFGDQLPPSLSNRYLERGFLSFKPDTKQEPVTINGKPANPFRFDIEASIERQAPEHSGGIRRRGGLVDAGSPESTLAQLGQDPLGPLAGNKYLLTSAGEKIGGHLWMGNPILSDVESEQLSIAEASILMSAGPQLKALCGRIRRSKLALLGADFTISILDQDGLEPAKPVNVSARVVSIDTSTGFSLSNPITSDYSKVAPPPFPLGTSNVTSA
jgi:hypothetical protein